jgi:hypothetical protein
MKVRKPSKAWRYRKKVHLLASLVAGIFVALFACLRVATQEVTAAGDDEDLLYSGREDVGEVEELFSVKLRTVEIPGPGGEFIRVYGVKMNVTDSLRNNHSIVRFSGIPYAVPPVDKLRFQV